MKRNAYFPLTLLLAFLLLLLSSCGKHTHTLGKWEVATKATCTTTGTRQKKCTECGEVVETESYTTGHAYDDNNVCLYCGRALYNEEYLNFEPVTVNGTEGYIVASAGNCRSADLVIPATHKSRPVLAIADGAFAESAYVKSVTLPRSVLRIGSRAFYGCKLLTTVTFPANSLCDSIGEFAFAECELLTQFTVPHRVTEIPRALFSGCVSLRAVTLHDDIATVGEDAFEACNSLKGREENGISYLGTASNPYFLVFGVTEKQSATLAVKEGAKFIGSYAFAGCIKLREIALPDGVTEVGAYAFAGCTALSSVYLPDTVTRMGAYTFRECTSLAAIALPEGLRALGAGAFFSCTFLASVEIPSQLETVGRAAFFGCGALTYTRYGHGFYLGNSQNPYLLLVGYVTEEHGNERHGDCRVTADGAANNILTQS